MDIKCYSVVATSLVSFTALSAVALSSINYTYAETTATANASVTILDACTAGTTDHTYNRTLALGTTETITGTDISITCNDYSGFDLYAVGYSGDSYEDTNTDMISSTNTAYNIKTNGTGNNSYWKMKLEEKNTSGQVDITSAFTSFTTIPSDYTKIASRNSSTSTGSITITPSYQVHISTTQPAGSYTGKVKYTIVHPNGTAAPTIPKTYIQDLTITACQKNVGTNGNATNVGDEIYVYDKRDEKAYKVRYINGECWMTQNLRYLGDTGSTAGTMTIGSNNSNVTNKSINLYSLLNAYNVGSFGDYSSHCNSTNGYNYACVYDSGSTSTGVWYNYYAASGGTISTNSDSTAASSDICPAGWHLPSGPNTTANTDINKLVGNTTSDYQNPTTGLTAFSAVTGGYFLNGSLNNTRIGYWWSATAGGTTLPYRYFLNYDSSDGQFSGSGSGHRYRGLFVRCVMKPTMQDTTVADLSEGEEKTVFDARDGNDYTIKKINGQLWMTQNLRYLGDTGSAAGTMTIGGGNSNVANGFITLYSLDSSNTGNFNAYSGHCDSTNGYNYACVYDSGSTSTGVWYNFYAASAGTISSNSNSTAAANDICPKNWHLPSGPNTTSNTDFNKLVGNTTSDYQNPTTGLTAFSAVAGGYYLNGSLNNTRIGYWWSATAYNTTNRYCLFHISSGNMFIGNDNGERYRGSFVRCVRSS